MARWVFPLDPDCPKVKRFHEVTIPDMEAFDAPVEDFLEDFEESHRRHCKRCQEYGAENVDID